MKELAWFVVWVALWVFVAWVAYLYIEPVVG